MEFNVLILEAFKGKIQRIYDSQLSFVILEAWRTLQISVVCFNFFRLDFTIRIVHQVISPRLLVCPLVVGLGAKRVR